MAPFPLPLDTLLIKSSEILVYFAIGFAFGYVLEISGFANSPKLAAQFYFREQTVLKVMFTAIVVAMVLLFSASALGLLDFNLVWVNPTYLWPGILGGLIMGVGFIVGGFCPGTSLVALTTFKLDGLFFTLGTLFGIFLFGETVGFYEPFWHSSYLGRFTIPEWLGLDSGVVVVLLVLMALFMFWGAEQLERILGGHDPRQAPRLRYLGAGALLLVAVLVMVAGQPTNADRWKRMAAEKEALLEQRAVHVHPGELLASMNDRRLRLRLLDVRPEADYNLFHLAEARWVARAGLEELGSQLLLEPADTVVVLMGNDEGAATEAWKVLVASGVPNVYILEGGVNGWLGLFAGSDERIRPAQAGGAEQLRYEFQAALGAAYPAANPDPRHYPLEYMSKIQLDRGRGPKGGGCG